ncbi:T9SS type A sorting domain-containing protein [Flavobacteriaceae bacterium]|nr:T9SS type A sorting domain-containing protein [Flavobacteriaceae bacterium]
MKKLTLLLCFVSFLTKAQNITVASGKSFTIEKTGAVTMSGNFSNSGTFTLNSDSDEFSSIIIGGTVTGNISYNRYVNSVGTNEWDLIGAPVDGQSISSFASANSSTLGTSSNIYAIGSYDNATNTWTNYTTSTIGSAGNFDRGRGYQMASVSGGTGILKFTGTPASTTQTQAIINNDAANAGTGKRWNLVANPFPSYIHGNANAHATNNFLTVNTDKLHDSYEAIYGYDADGSGYTAYNNTSSALNLAPGQAFMVASDNTSSDNISFTTDMRTIVGGDDLIVGDILEDTFELIIKLYEGDTELDYTRFYFADGLSLGLDPGYDAGNFNQGASLMSRLVEEDEGVGLAINAMGLENVNDVVVPLEINRESGNSFRISIDTFDIYAGTNVYLEDNQQGTMTLLNEQDFELTPENNLSGVGRFFIHLTETTFSIDNEVDTNLLNAYKLDRNNFIIVEGLTVQSGITNVKLYSLLGREILSTELNNSINTQTISTERIATGVYVIKLQSGNNLITKKLIIK